jgi:hypothetical protein
LPETEAVPPPAAPSELEPEADLEREAVSELEAESEHEAETALAHPDTENGVALIPAPGPGPRLAPDPGLYAILGLDPSVSDVEIQITYRRLAARLGNNPGDAHALRQLNIAYEVLGNPARRAEYDRGRTELLAAPVPTASYQGRSKGPVRVTRRTRPRAAVQPNETGRGLVLVLFMVVALSIAASVLLILPRLSINLSALNSLSNVLPASVGGRRGADATPTAAASTDRAPTPTVAPGLAERFAGSGVSVATPNPPQNTPESIAIRLRLDGQAASNMDVWATLDYRTTTERWPPTGSVKTDGNGSATITFDIGDATPGYPVQVHVYAQMDNQQLSWSTSFTPR